jgi:hypothetical protein
VCTCYIDNLNYLINNLLPRAFSDADSATKVHGLQQGYLGTLKCGDEINIKEVILNKSVQSLEVLGTVWRILWERLCDCFEDCFRERLGNMFGTGLGNVGGYFRDCVGESFGIYVEDGFG